VDGRRGTVVFVIGNHALPRDRRVWQECRSVQRLGFRVVGVSPTGVLPGTEGRRDEVEGIAIRRFPRTPGGEGLAGYGREFAGACLHSARS
jgi:hypothetical protein